MFPGCHGGGLDWQCGDSAPLAPQFDIVDRATHIEAWFVASGGAPVYSASGASPGLVIKSAVATAFGDLVVSLFDGAVGCGAQTTPTCHKVPFACGGVR